MEEVMIFENKYRTVDLGSLRIDDVGKTVRLSGFVDTIRKLGGITFVVLRDFYGKTQIILPETMNISLNKEDVISVEGEVTERSSKNPNTFANNVGFRVARNANLDSGKFVIINEIETVDKHDISGDKTLIVYFSWRGGRLGQNVNDISKLASDSVIGEALSVYCSDDTGWVIFNKFYYFWLGLNSSIILNSSIKMFSC